MAWQYNPYIWPLLGLAAMAAWLGGYAWRHRWLPTARLFGASMVVPVVWCVAYALQLLSANAGQAFFWARVQLVACIVLPPAWLMITLQQTGRSRWLRPAAVALFCAIPAVSILLLWTNDLHHLMAAEYSMERVGAYADLRVQGGPWFWVHVGYSYLLMLGTLALLAERAIRMPSILWRQPLVVVVGLPVLLTWNLLYIAGIVPKGPVDPTTIFFTGAHILVSWTVLRSRLFDVTPVARATVMDSMEEGTVVVDTNGRVVDLNPAAQRLLDVGARQALGAPAERVLAPYQELLPALEGDAGRDGEMDASLSGEPRRIEYHVTALTGAPGVTAGRLIILRDVTERHRQAAEREKLIAELQDALAQVKTLSGLLPICAWCGRIRDDTGYWQRLERYVAEHSDAQFTHGICPDCLARQGREFAGEDGTRHGVTEEGLPEVQEG